jgi:hypothetical protein
MFIRHLTQLFRDLFGYAWQNKAWWIVPMVFFLLLLGALIFVGESAAPFIYTLF